MNIVGEAENVVMQHGGIRAIHGWLDMAQPYKYVFIPDPHRVYLFKIIYNYRRPDVEKQIAAAQGFLGEIVYDAQDVAAKIPPPKREGTAVVLLEFFEPVGLVNYAPLVRAAMEKVGRR